MLKKIEKMEIITFKDITDLFLLKNSNNTLIIAISFDFFQSWVIIMENIEKIEGNGSYELPPAEKISTIEEYNEILNKLRKEGERCIGHFDCSIKLLKIGDTLDEDLYVLNLNTQKIIGESLDFYELFEEDELLDYIYCLSKEQLAQHFSRIQINAQNLIYNQLKILIQKESTIPEKLIKIQIYEIRNQLKHTFESIWDKQMDLEAKSIKRTMVTA
ncbi:hypothetical protein DSAG12_02273 [Promethearchaeum syntrophicum]|uniref:Uncharacterized protein n=1 Tax=Promethearchaeum syntrophicum TaxID=2594042 RepID=A0A5B9DCG2_9ARCH|nr:hypothetical protein [Candidatus Prometheoarchaeum syntrophicum]QEE16443.1 hypothetical protein DSAG12_02273 [Candidatus Prometheoarchaeum syntrophicum]